MMRAVAAVATIGLTVLIAPAGARDSPPVYGAPRNVTPADLWTDQSGTFSFNKPRSWRNVDVASPVGASTLQIVAGDDNAECWFTRVPRPTTATLSPMQVIKIRSAPIDVQLWQKAGAGQALLAGAGSVREASVETIGVWPVQVAWFSGAHADVLGALHSRPGMDIWAFCATKDGRNREDLLRQVALSVTTPRDYDWQRTINAQANFTAVP